MEHKHRDRLRHLWEADIKSVQKLVKITGQGRSTIYKNIKKLKQGDDLKRAPGSGRKRMLKGNDRSRVSQIPVKNSIFKCSDRRESRGQRITGGQSLDSLAYPPQPWLPQMVAKWLSLDYIKSFINALPTVMEKVIAVEGDTVK